MRYLRSNQRYAGRGTVLCWPDQPDCLLHQFRLFANAIILTAESRVHEIMSSVEGLSIDITSYANAHGPNQWPFVTLPDWEVRSNQIRSYAELTQVGWSCLVRGDQREAYANYTVANQGWIEEGLRVQGRSSTTPGQGIIPVLYPVDPKLTMPDLSLPIWQIGPTPDINTMINQDVLTSSIELQNWIVGIMETHRPTITYVNDYEGVWENFYSWFANDDDLTEDHGFHHPTSTIFFPIHEDFKSNTIVGIVSGSISWDKFFHNMVPEGLNGFVVYMHDPCGLSFSYAIDGSKTTLLGQGDHHDTAYQHLGVYREFIPELTEDGCGYSITVYPGRELEIFYESNKPAIYTSVVVLVFFFTAMVFILYDFLVTRRQTIVSSAAAKTQALVSSLFPKNVQQRILDDANEQALKEQRAKSRLANGFRGKSQLKDFLDGDNGDEEEARDKDVAFTTRPIADLFPETTVLFADIAGFTAWSSTREPSQVFTLLETVSTGHIMSCRHHHKPRSIPHISPHALTDLPRFR